MLGTLGSWWNAVELWIVQLWFPLQFVLVMAVVVPVCWGVAVGADVLAGRVVKRLRRRAVR